MSVTNGGRRIFACTRSMFVCFWGKDQVSCVSTAQLSAPSLHIIFLDKSWVGGPYNRGTDMICIESVDFLHALFDCHMQTQLNCPSLDNVVLV